MNIFYLDNDPERCAQLHCDKHVVKMIVETAQLLSTAHHVLDGDDALKGIYKSTHKNHPSAVWARASNQNYKWLHQLLASLCHEYTHRYHKVHKVEREGLLQILRCLPINIECSKWSEPPLAMPDEYKTSNANQSYFNYYNGSKASFARWTNRPTPTWFNA